MYLQRLDALRQAMRAQGVHACLILSSDPHLSEYLPEYWMIRRWLTGFTGSVGTVLVTEQHAQLWVDSRYWVQAERDLQGSGFVLQRIQSAMDTSYIQWLADNLPPAGVLAIDGRTLSVAGFEALDAAMRNRQQGVTIRLDLDLPGAIWTDRPALPTAPIYALTPEVACRDRLEKFASIRAQMEQCGASHHWISTLDDIAWILNLRGSDVQFNPVFVAHLLVTKTRVQLFIDPAKVSAYVAAALSQDGVELLAYEQATPVLQSLTVEDRLLMDPRRVVCALVQATPAKTIRASNPSTLLKACKTNTELENWRAVMRRDGAALCEFFTWLDQAIATRDHKHLDECMIDVELTARRANQTGFVSRSFATIAAYQANGAMPHYRATEASHAVIQGNGLLLIDSGAQYQGGTTDITRMVAVGALSDAQRADCTAVLSAMIALSKLTFPEGIGAPLLDAVARAPLWQRQLDYGHGTGHGVGYFLNVHEGPQVLSYKAPMHPDMGLKPGMVTSNEPGLYRAGEWGVRIENLVCCQPVAANEFGRFLAFETLTLCPIDTRCLAPELLRTDEIEWLDAYHRVVREQLSPLLTGDALQWLFVRTAPLLS